jgi:23S rRNA pseudouridine955/2504/2580 synthase
VSVQKITVSTVEAGLRLDRWFRSKFPQVTHGRLEKLLRKGEIRVDGGRVRANLRLVAGMVVRVPPLPEPEPVNAVANAPVSPADVAALRDRILYRDDALIVIDKPSGLAVQGGSGMARHLDGMLDALQFDATERPRLVHRLDKDTSGVLVLARTRSAATAATAAFADRTTEKTYWALVSGGPDAEEGRLDSNLIKVATGGGREQMASDSSGKSAVTLFRCLARGEPHVTWLALTPLTGRTHQLRVQTAEAEFPIVGDRRYGQSQAIKKDNAFGRGLHLHARQLVIPHPKGGLLSVAAPLPPHMARSWGYLGWEEPPAPPAQRWSP